MVRTAPSPVQDSGHPGPLPHGESVLFPQCIFPFVPCCHCFLLSSSFPPGSLSQRESQACWAVNLFSANTGAAQPSAPLADPTAAPSSARSQHCPSICSSGHSPWGWLRTHVAGQPANKAWGPNLRVRADGRVLWKLRDGLRSGTTGQASKPRGRSCGAFRAG